MLDFMDCQSCSHRKAGKSLFSCLSCSEVEEVENHRSSRSFQAGQVLFHQGDPHFGIYCLNSGLVKLESFSSEGGAQLLRLARPGEPLGYRAYLSRGRQRYRATAVTSVSVCALSSDYLHTLQKDVPTFSQSLIEKLSHDLEHAECRWLGLMQKNSEQRVAQILLEFQSAGEGWPPRKDMAHLVDMTPETFTRILARFEQRGWLERTRQKIELLQLEQLEKL
jgi:CRP/FNR family transcriptional regulator, polysaccharide utilization system transcription regulator